MLAHDFENLHGKALMDAYQFIHVGIITAPDPSTFSIQINLEDALAWEKCVYIFVFGEEIVRVGSSKGPLKKRMQQWGRDVTNALRKMDDLDHKKTNTPEKEALIWRDLLEQYGQGEVYARQAATVTTPVGTFRAYMDEESILINRHKPVLNRHSNR